MFKIRILTVLLCLACTAACYNPFSSFLGLFGGGGDNDEKRSMFPERVPDHTHMMSLAIGGVAAGLDEIVLQEPNGALMDMSDTELECAADPPIVKILPRPGFTTEAAGSGVRIVPTSPGVTAVTCSAWGEDLGILYEVTVPPQSLIAILVAEARGEIAKEAAPDEGGAETDPETGRSPTAEALGSVIRNRVWFTNSKGRISLFRADEQNYDLDPPSSFYDAIIYAEGQFSPALSTDPNHSLFLDADRRIFLEDEELIAYDQAVITAAGIFNGEIEDNTTGAFAFYSPTTDQWQSLSLALSMYYSLIPDGAGVSDADFPAFDPVQVLIHPDVPKKDGVPAFVFVRMRLDSDPAVTDRI